MLYTEKVQEGKQYEERAKNYVRLACYLFDHFNLDYLIKDSVFVFGFRTLQICQFDSFCRLCCDKRKS